MMVIIKKLNMLFVRVVIDKIHKVKIRIRPKKLHCRHPHAHHCKSQQKQNRVATYESRHAALKHRHTSNVDHRTQ